MTQIGPIKHIKLKHFLAQKFILVWQKKKKKKSILAHQNGFAQFKKPNNNILPELPDRLITDPIDSGRNSKIGFPTAIYPIRMPTFLKPLKLLRKGLIEASLWPLKWLP